MTAVIVGEGAGVGKTTIVDVIRRFSFGAIPLEQACLALKPAFGAEAFNGRVHRYLEQMLSRVELAELPVEAAAANIWEVAVATEAGNPDINLLLDVGRA